MEQNVLTYSWNRILLEKLIVTQPVKNTKVHYRVQKSQLLVPIPSQINQSTPSHTICLRSFLILFSHLHPVLPIGLFPSDFPTKILYHFSSPPSVIRGCTQKFPDCVDNEIYAYNNNHLLGSNTKGYGGKTH
jgi:hypothetical protein